MSKRFNLDIRNYSEVISIDRANKTVTVHHIKTGKIYAESYDVLILSTGAKPVRPNIEGINEAKNLFILRNIPDADMIRKMIDVKKPKSAVVIGGGFIGIEMAENLYKRGPEITLVERLSQVLAPLDLEMSQLVHQELNTKGINLVLNDAVARLEDEGRKIVLESGLTIDTDMVILSIGVTPELPCKKMLETAPIDYLSRGVVPENPLAKSCGLAIGERGHIITTKQLQTIDDKTGNAVDDIYAIGDVIQVTDYITGNQTAVPLAWPANRQGRLVADHINGIDISYEGSIGTFTLKVFNLIVAATGNNERQLKAKSVKYKAIHAHRTNHATFYPNATNIALKLLFDPDTGKILGAQAVGREGTEKRIDVIATAISLGGTIRNLPQLELCYAPPFSSAKDPVNILGYIACNVADNIYDVVQWYEIDGIAKKGGYLLDVRTPEEFKESHINGSINIELDVLRDRISEIKISKDTPIYVICWAGLRAYIAIKILTANGFERVYNLSGGYSTYKGAKYKLKNYDVL